eukprot:535159_1
MELQQKQNLSVLQTILIALFSTIGSIALTDSFGLSDKQNGTVAVIMASLSFVIATTKLFMSWKAANNFEGKLDAKIVVSMRMKSIALLMATITDSVFDALQGVAAIKGEYYTSNALLVLLMATWIGVTDEIIEAFVEILFMSFMENDGCTVTFCMAFLLWCIVESCMGVYLLSTYNDTALQVSGIIVEFVLIIVCGALCIYFWGIKKKK